MRVRSEDNITVPEGIAILVVGVAGGVGLAYVVALVVTRIMLSALLGVM